MDKRQSLLRQPSIVRKQSARSYNTVPRSTLRVRCRIHRSRQIAARVKAKVDKHLRRLMPTRRVLHLQVLHRPAITPANVEAVAVSAEEVANAVAKLGPEQQQTLRAASGVVRRPPERRQRP